ncbi:MAG: sporulation protein [Mycobacteriales bacterium]
MNTDRLAAGSSSDVDVDTILTNPIVTPGGRLDGEVHFRGGKTDYNIATLSLEFLATLEAESGNPNYPLTIPFGYLELANELPLAAGARQVVPFAVTLPWLTPINTVGAKRLKGVALGVHTGMRMGGTFNFNDSDPLQAAPVPIAEQVLKAAERTRFTLSTTDLEDIRVTPAHTSFVQQIRCVPGPEFAPQLGELQVAFISDDNGVEVLLTTDSGARQQFTVPHSDAVTFNADGLLEAGLRALGTAR